MDCCSAGSNARCAAYPIRFRARRLSSASTLARTSASLSPEYSTIMMAAGSPWTNPIRARCSMFSRARSRIILSVTSTAYGPVVRSSTDDSSAAWRSS